MEKESFYRKSLKNDIKCVNSKYNTKQANFVRDLSMIGGSTILISSALFGVGIAISGNIAFGLIFATTMQVSILEIIGHLEDARSDNKNKYDLSKYCASERIEELSERLKDEGIDVSYEAIKNATINSRNYSVWSPIESNTVEENRIVVKSGPDGYQFIDQRIEKLRYLREQATTYQLKCVTRDGQGKVKRKSM